ncbi:hypothetical protein N2152v2_001441 [Parachlorella kessleri]
MQHAEFLKNKGNTAFAEKRYQEAIQLYTDCLVLRPDLAVVFANRAAAYIKLKQYSPAELDCTKAIELDSRHMKAYKRRAEARYYLGSYALVGDDADAALRLDPMQKDLYKFKAKALKKLQEQQGAAQQSTADPDVRKESTTKLLAVQQEGARQGGKERSKAQQGAAEHAVSKQALAHQVAEQGTAQQFVEGSRAAAQRGAECAGQAEQGTAGQGVGEQDAALLRGAGLGAAELTGNPVPRESASPAAVSGPTGPPPENDAVAAGDTGNTAEPTSPAEEQQEGERKQREVAAGDVPPLPRLLAAGGAAAPAHTARKHKASAKESQEKSATAQAAIKGPSKGGGSAGLAGNGGDVSSEAPASAAASVTSSPGTSRAVGAGSTSAPAAGTKPSDVADAKLVPLEKSIMATAAGEQVGTGKSRSADDSRRSSSGRSSTKAEAAIASTSVDAEVTVQRLGGRRPEGHQAGLPGVAGAAKPASSATENQPQALAASEREKHVGDAATPSMSRPVEAGRHAENEAGRRAAPEDMRDGASRTASGKRTSSSAVASGGASSTGAAVLPAVPPPVQRPVSPPGLPEEVSDDEALHDCPPDPTLKASGLATAAEKLTRSSEVAARVALYSEALELVPTELGYYVARATAHLEAGSAQQARCRAAFSDTTVALRLMEDSGAGSDYKVPALLLRAKARALEGDLEGGRKDLDAVLRCRTTAQQQSEARSLKRSLLERIVAADKAKRSRQEREREVHSYGRGKVVIEDITEEPNELQQAASVVERWELSAYSAAAKARKAAVRQQERWHGESAQVEAENEARRDRNAVRRQRRERRVAALRAAGSVEVTRHRKKVLVVEEGSSSDMEADDEQQQAAIAELPSVSTKGTASQPAAAEAALSAKPGNPEVAGHQLAAARPAQPADSAPAPMPAGGKLPAALEQPAGERNAAVPLEGVLAPALPVPPADFPYKVPIHIVEEEGDSTDGEEGFCLELATAASATAGSIPSAGPLPGWAAGGAAGAEAGGPQQQQQGLEQLQPREPSQQPGEVGRAATSAAKLAQPQLAAGNPPSPRQHLPKPVPKGPPLPAQQGLKVVLNTAQGPGGPQQLTNSQQQQQQGDTPASQAAGDTATMAAAAAAAAAFAGFPTGSPPAVAELGDTQMEALKEAGDRAYKAGDLAGADRSYSRCLQHDPCDTRIWSNRAQCRVAQGRFAEALADCDAALAVPAPTKAAPLHKILLRRAAALQHLGRFAEACDDLDRAKEACTTKSERLMISKRQQEVVRAMEAAGCGLQPSGGALPPQQRYSSSPPDAAAPGARPAAMAAAGSDGAPQEERCEPPPPGVQQPLAQQVEQPRPGKQQRLEQEHGRSPAHGEQQGIQASQEPLPPQEQQQKQLAASGAVRELGNRRFNAGDWPGALAHYAEALQLNPRCEKTLINKGAALLKLGRWEEAAASCSQALELVPDHAKAFLRRGQARRQLGDFHGAFDDLQRAGELAGEDGDDAIRRELEIVLPVLARQEQEAKQQQEQGAKQLQQQPPLHALGEGETMHSMERPAPQVPPLRGAPAAATSPQEPQQVAFGSPIAAAAAAGAAARAAPAMTSEPQEEGPLPQPLPAPLPPLHGHQSVGQQFLPHESGSQGRQTTQQPEHAQQQEPQAQQHTQESAACELDVGEGGAGGREQPRVSSHEMQPNVSAEGPSTAGSAGRADTEGSPTGPAPLQKRRSGGELGSAAARMLALAGVRVSVAAPPASPTLRRRVAVLEVSDSDGDEGEEEEVVVVARGVPGPGAANGAGAVGLAAAENQQGMEAHGAVEGPTWEGQAARGAAQHAQQDAAQQAQHGRKPRKPVTNAFGPGGHAAPMPPPVQQAQQPQRQVEGRVLQPQSSNSQQAIHGPARTTGAAASKLPPAPRSAVELDKALASLVGAEAELGAKWLRGIDPSCYPRVIRDGLSPSHLEGLAQLMLPQLAASDPAFALSTLQGLAAVKDFPQAVRWLDPHERVPIAQVVNQLEKAGQDVTLLRQEYQL